MGDIFGREQGFRFLMSRSSDGRKIPGDFARSVNEIHGLQDAPVCGRQTPMSLAIVVLFWYRGHERIGR
jgi:hypothetical protein